MFLAVLVVTSLSLIPSVDTGTIGTNTPKILILGAGISGVTVAKTLNGLGYTNFQIVEGAGKVGGRIVFPIDLGGCTVELGAVFENGAEANPFSLFCKSTTCPGSGPTLMTSQLGTLTVQTLPI